MTDSSGPARPRLVRRREPLAPHLVAAVALELLEHLAALGRVAFRPGEAPALRRPVGVRPAPGVAGRPGAGAVDCASARPLGRAPVGPRTKPASASASVEPPWRSPCAVPILPEASPAPGLRTSRDRRGGGCARPLASRTMRGRTGRTSRPRAAARSASTSRCSERVARIRWVGSGRTSSRARCRASAVLRRDPARAHHLEPVGLRDLVRPGRRDEEARVVANGPLLRGDPVGPVRHAVGGEDQVEVGQEPPERGAVLAAAGAVGADLAERRSRPRDARPGRRPAGCPPPRTPRAARPPRSRWPAPAGATSGKLPRGLGAPEPPAPRLHAGRRVGRLRRARRETRRPRARTGCSGCRWSSSTSKPPSARRARGSPRPPHGRAAGRADASCTAPVVPCRSARRQADAARISRRRRRVRDARRVEWPGARTPDPRRRRRPRRHGVLRRPLPAPARLRGGARPVEERRRRARRRVRRRRPGGGAPERAPGLPRSASGRPSSSGSALTAVSSVLFGLADRVRPPGPHAGSRPASAARARGPRPSAGSRARRRPSGAAS